MKKYANKVLGIMIITTIICFVVIIISIISQIITGM